MVVKKKMGVDSSGLLGAGCFASVQFFLHSPGSHGFVCSQRESVVICGRGGKEILAEKAKICCTRLSGSGWYVCMYVRKADRSRKEWKNEVGKKGPVPLLLFFLACRFLLMPHCHAFSSRLPGATISVAGYQDEKERCLGKKQQKEEKGGGGEREDEREQDRTGQKGRRVRQQIA